jgi:hypothetical protein
MAFIFIRLNASANLDRHLMVSRAQGAISECGSILDFHLFANRSVCLKFELPVGKIAQLHDLLTQAGLKLSAESERLLTNCRKGLTQLDEKAGASEITGTLLITFIHDEPDFEN